MHNITISKAQKDEIMRKMAEQYHKLSPQTIETVEREMERLFGKTVETVFQDWETVLIEQQSDDKTEEYLDQQANERLSPQDYHLNLTAIFGNQGFYQEINTPDPIGSGTKTTITLEYYTPGANADYAEMTSIIIRDHIQKLMRQATHIQTYKLNRKLHSYTTGKAFPTKAR